MKSASPANATALPDRRRLLTAGAAAVASVALPVAGLAAAQNTQDDLAISLWEKRNALKPLYIQASRAYHEATDRLPWWAKPGPNLLNHDGTFSGQIVGWPAIQDQKRPDSPGVFMLARPGKGDIANYLKWMPEEYRAPQIKKARSELAARLRAKRSEERRAGLLAASRALDNLSDQMIELDGQIDNLSSATPNAAAARVLNAALFHSRMNDKIDESPEFEVALKALEFLRPHLRGIIKEHVDELFSNPGLRVKQYKAYPYKDGEADADVSGIA